MTHSIDAVKSFIQNLILSNFCVGVFIKFKIFDNTDLNLNLQLIDMHILNLELKNLKYHRCSKNRTCKISLECHVRYA